MATFTCARYPGLTLQDADGIWAQFTDGEFETDDARVAGRLRGLPEEEGITEVKRSLAKSSPDADGGTGAGSGAAKKTAPPKAPAAPKTPPAPKE